MQPHMIEKRAKARRNEFLHTAATHCWSTETNRGQVRTGRSGMTATTSAVSTVRSMSEVLVVGVLVVIDADAALSVADVVPSGAHPAGLWLSATDDIARTASKRRP
jgi:hypothetical protein